MSKTLSATCAAGVVLVDGIPLPTAVILSEGLGPSAGIAVLDESSAFYLAKTSPDLNQTLEKLIDVLSQVKSALDRTGAALTKLDTAAFLIAADAGVPSPPIAAADITAIGTAATALDLIKGQLTTLKEALK